jgi:hypothetical protein
MILNTNIKQRRQRFPLSAQPNLFGGLGGGLLRFGHSPHTMVSTRIVSALTAVSLLAAPLSAFAQTSSFKDVSPSNPASAAIEYLKGKGIIAGYPDGTFRPDAKVNRAEALKIIVAPYVSQEVLATADASAYGDVPAGSWFLPYVEAARQVLGVIDGPPKAANFNPTRNVNKAEFIKMLLIANKVDPVTTLGEIRGGLSTDVANPDEWFYPYMRFAVASSMTMVAEDGTLNPGQELTRAQVALLLYRLEMYKQGRRTQALLTEAETEIINVLSLFENKDIVNADYAATRSTVAARGALISAPDEAIVKGAVKISEGFQALVRAYKAGLSGDLDGAIALSGTAWNSAAKAMEFSSGLKDVATQMQGIAKTLADDARALKAQGGVPAQ